MTNQVTLLLFRILWGIDALICAVVVVFFFIGLTDGSVSSFNIGIWAAILGALAVILAGSASLKKLGHPVFASILLLLLAIPGLLFGLFTLLIVASNTAWN